jgi:hypothetical protein
LLGLGVSWGVGVEPGCEPITADGRDDRRSIAGRCVPSRTFPLVPRGANAAARTTAATTNAAATRTSPRCAVSVPAVSAGRRRRIVARPIGRSSGCFRVDPPGRAGWIPSARRRSTDATNRTTEGGTVPARSGLPSVARDLAMAADRSSRGPLSLSLRCPNGRPVNRRRTHIPID